MVVSLLLVALAGAPEPALGPMTRRIAESAQAAQAYQGPLDGGWRFRDGDERRDLELQDPPSRPDHVGGAWRDARGQAGYLELRRVSGHEVELTFDGSPAGTVRLTRESERRWVGRSHRRLVVLERRLAMER